MPFDEKRRRLKRSNILKNTKIKKKIKCLYELQNFKALCAILVEMNGKLWVWWQAPRSDCMTTKFNKCSIYVNQIRQTWKNINAIEKKWTNGFFHSKENCGSLLLADMNYSFTSTELYLKAKIIRMVDLVDFHNKKLISETWRQKYGAAAKLRLYYSIDSRKTIRLKTFQFFRKMSNFGL